MNWTPNPVTSLGAGGAFCLHIAAHQAAWGG